MRLAFHFLFVSLGICFSVLLPSVTFGFLEQDNRYSEQDNMFWVPNGFCRGSESGTHLTSWDLVWLRKVSDNEFECSEANWTWTKESDCLNYRYRWSFDSSNCVSGGRRWYLVRKVTMNSPIQYSFDPDLPVLFLPTPDKDFFLLAIAPKNIPRDAYDNRVHHLGCIGDLRLGPCDGDSDEIIVEERVMYTFADSSSSPSGDPLTVSGPICVKVLSRSGDNFKVEVYSVSCKGSPVTTASIPRRYFYSN